MKKYFSLLVLSAAFFVAGCGKKKNKAAIEQTETVVTHFVQAEQAGADTKEDYSQVA